MLGMTAAPTSALPVPQAPPRELVIGGLVSAQPLSTVLALQAREAQQAQPPAQTQVISGLAGHVRRHWQIAKQAKIEIEEKMLEAVRSRRGEYPAKKLAEIRQSGGSEIYMLLFATKARQAKAILGDALIGAGTEKPWTLTPSAKPEIPPEEVTAIMQGVYQLVEQAELVAMSTGQPGLDHDTIRQLLRDARDRAQAQVEEEARRQCELAEKELEDILLDGGWLQALDEFLDDLTTFKTAFIKGPIVRNVPVLEWQAQPDGTSKPVRREKQQLQWERVDPFKMYPVAWAKDTNDAPLIERHQLTRGTLESLRGVEGYNSAEIEAVLSELGTGGLHEWLSIDTQQPQAEGRPLVTQQSDLIDALQYWGSVSGKMLLEWGMDAGQVPDAAKEYEVECWLIGAHVIKAVLNPDPLGRRPYYSDGFHRIPGAFWHNSLYDLIEDCQNMCNSAARALANNLGIASGPQVDINVERLADGASITGMYPWKIWQTKSDPMGSTAKAVNFFSPDSHAQELMAVFDKFSMMADEYSGIPRYLTGAEGTPGAGRTASGLSMMIGNAGKMSKQRIASIDMRIIEPSVSRLYEDQIQKNPALRGDLKPLARGAMSLATREAAQVRRNEFLQFTNNPADLQIMGLGGRAALLREAAKGLDMNPDKIVPSESQLRLQNLATAMAAVQQPEQGGDRLMNGEPATDHFSPTPA
jgi:hypothetical protein